MPFEEIPLGDKTVYLVGTAHVSDESVKDVEEAILKYKPDAVAVELCEQRYRALKEEQRWDETEIGKVLSSDRVYLFLLQIMLANFQRKIGEDIGVKPGAEMFRAVQIAEASGVPVVLADRDIRVTLKRAMDMMTLKEKLRILYGFISGFIEGEEINQELVERMKERDILTELIEELSVETPSVKKVLVDERDQHIAYMIHRTEAKRVVAVVGAGHMDGIKRNLLELDRMGVVVTHVHSFDGLEIRGMDKRKIKLISWAVPSFLVALFAWLFISRGEAMTLNMLLRLFLLQGTGAALGAAVALGHPLTVLTAFLAAPFAALHPAIAVGWIAGYVELKLRKPRVIDFKNLMKLRKMSDYWGNRVVKIILIVTFANIGSTLGTLIALPYLATLI